MTTGQAAKSFFDLPYRSETECMERALTAYELKPDMLLSLGGETFSVYPMKNGVIRNIISSSKCAAGTGEFIVQQFKRMGLSLDQGLKASLHGKRVQLATRCSVHCKSDATHKLNKGECQPGDIAKSLVFDLAKKVAQMLEMAQWSVETIVVTGGVSKNHLFTEHLGSFLKDSEIRVLPESPYLDAFGAALLARDHAGSEHRLSANWMKSVELPFERLEPLNVAEHLSDYRVEDDGAGKIEDGTTYLLGVDAGSTTTKAVLLDAHRFTVGAACYLRTLGDPVSAVKKCIQALIDQIGDKTIQVIQAGTTGSGREMVSVYLNSCSSFNEILTHARAAAHEVPDIDTVFEIGGQDSKFISFLNGIPVDYAMNEGCSAGTGSFLDRGDIAPQAIDLNHLLKGEIQIKGTFRCKACENICQIQNVKIRGRSYPFGGLCSKYEMLRHGRKDAKEGRDLVVLREKLMFKE